jgi:comEA protein
VVTTPVKEDRMLRTLIVVFSLSVVAAVPSSAFAQSKSSPPTSAKPAVVGTININSASATELQRLPGIGAKTAGRVIEYRQKNGPFKKIEELMNVRGVGEKNFLKLKNQISVGAPKAEHAGLQQQ